MIYLYIKPRKAYHITCLSLFLFMPNYAQQDWINSFIKMDAIRSLSSIVTRGTVPMQNNYLLSIKYLLVSELFETS